MRRSNSTHVHVEVINGDVHCYGTVYRRSTWLARRLPVPSERRVAIKTFLKGARSASMIRRCPQHDAAIAFASYALFMLGN